MPPPVARTDDVPVSGDAMPDGVPGPTDARLTVAAVARRLGNTPTICRKCYIHPEVLSAYAEGRLAGLNGARPAVALRRLLRRQSAAASLRASLKLVRLRAPREAAGRKIPTV